MGRGDQIGQDPVAVSAARRRAGVNERLWADQAIAIAALVQHCLFHATLEAIE
jgi:hypothetical protein